MIDSAAWTGLPPPGVRDYRFGPFRLLTVGPGAWQLWIGAFLWTHVGAIDVFDFGGFGTDARFTIRRVGRLWRAGPAL
jgi:hypothetical protein